MPVRAHPVPAISGAARAALRVLATLAIACIASDVPADQAVPHYDLHVQVIPAVRHIGVAGKIVIAPGAAVDVRLDERFRIHRFEPLDAPASAVRRAAGGANRWQLRAPADRPLEVAVDYAGQAARMDADLDHRQVLAIAQPLVGLGGVYLPAGTAWYPQPERGRVTYRVRVGLPGSSYRAIVPGRLVEERIHPGGTSALYQSIAALPGIDVLAGDYRVEERTLQLPQGREIALRTYFHADLAALAPAYLQAAAEHLARYDGEIGPHAFGSYSIVSSAIPVGFGMPGIAYLGKDVLRLPFIPATSLRHEVLHDWWGNGVVPDYAQGNWAEGLTTLLADYAHRAEQGPEQGKEMRLGWLRDYAAVRPELDRPLAGFLARRHGADQAVGYNKTAFVFFMLRDRIGPERFRAALQRFWRDRRLTEAGWNDLQRAFEAESGVRLQGFFEQWVRRSGAPALEVTEARRTGGAKEHRLSLRVRQGGAPFDLEVPVRIQHAQGYSDVRVALSGSEARLDAVLPARALSVQLDPDIRLFRRLHRDEIAPTLRPVLIDPHARLVVAAEGDAVRAAALRVAEAALEAGVKLFRPEGDAIDAPMLVVGLHAEVARIAERLRLPLRRVPGAQPGDAVAYASRMPNGQPIAIVAAADAAQLAALARPLPHLGAQSYAVFSGSRSVARGVWPVEARRYPVTD